MACGVHAQVAVEPRFCRRLASLKTIDLLMTLALDPKDEPRNPHTTADGRRAIKEQAGDGGGGRGDCEQQPATGSTQGQKALQALRLNGKKRISRERVRVSTPYVGSLRYCVVAIVERMSSVLDDDGEPASFTVETTSVVVGVAKEIHKTLTVVVLLLSVGSSGVMWCYCYRCDYFLLIVSVVVVAAVLV